MSEVVIIGEGNNTVVKVISEGPQGPPGDVNLLAPVAFSGDYDDLTNTPTIPDVSGKADTTYVDSQDTAVATTAQTNLTTHTSRTDNPHSVTKAQVGLANADNTSDSAKPVSMAQQAALDTKVDKVAGKGLSTNDYTTSEQTKLAGIASGATQNATDAQLRDRSTHTGTQAISTVTGLQAALDGKQATGDYATNTALTSGLAGKANTSHTHAIADTTGLQAALDGTQPLDSDLTAIAGLTPTNDDLLQRKAGAWTNRTPVQVKTDLALTKGDVGLGNVNNTSDVDKPVSTAMQTALDAKEDLSNKSTSTSLGTSNTLYPTQGAVKGYVDTADALKVNKAGDTMTGALGIISDGFINMSLIGSSSSGSVLRLNSGLSPTGSRNGAIWHEAGYMGIGTLENDGVTWRNKNAMVITLVSQFDLCGPWGLCDV